MRIEDHPILGPLARGKPITLWVDGVPVPAFEGEPIAAALTAAGYRVFRRTVRQNRPRGVFCAVGRCTDCVMIVNGQPNVRTCVTPAADGMLVDKQLGVGRWGAREESEGGCEQR